MTGLNAYEMAYKHGLEDGERRATKKKGTWIEDSSGALHCSLCFEKNLKHELFGNTTAKYCHHCGAEMTDSYMGYVNDVDHSLPAERKVDLYITRDGKFFVNIDGEKIHVHAKDERRRDSYPLTIEEKELFLDEDDDYDN